MSLFPRLHDRFVGEMGYRRDIDGLRTLAVTPVVLFHAGFGWLPGGFVGVDIFFVISGYLITSVILRDISNGCFTIAGFYERRFRRIVPALAAMTLVSTAAAQIFLLPDQLSSFSNSIVAATLFVSNVFFWSTSGYFAPAADWMPLLHTWSLAVEEQYYIVFPIFMAVASRRATVVLLALALVASFGLGVLASYRFPAAAFYLIPFRAWELLLGALLAIQPPIPGLDRRGLREVCAAIGLTLIGAALVDVDSNTTFPGFAALLPCVGATLIIAAGAGGRSLVGDLLSTTPMAAIGLISYSLYLWHWPIFVFLRLALATIALPTSAAAGGVAASLVVAALSWRFIEQPFRSIAFVSRGQVFAFAGCASILIVGLGGMIRSMDGASWRFGPSTLAYVAASRDIDPVRDACRPASFDAACMFGATSKASPTYAIWGDSHAAALRPAVALAMGADGKGVLFWAGACAPLLGAQIVVHANRAQCLKYNSDVAARITASESTIETVFLAGRWAYWSEGTRPAVGGALFDPIVDSATEKQDLEENHRVFRRALTRTVAKLITAGKRVVIVGPTPEYGIDIPNLLALSERWRFPMRAPLTAEDYQARNAFVLPALNSVASATGAKLIDLADLFCGHGRCEIMHQGRPLYSDADHLSLFGATHFVAPYLDLAMQHSSAGLRGF